MSATFNVLLLFTLFFLVILPFYLLLLVNLLRCFTYLFVVYLIVVCLLVDSFAYSLVCFASFTHYLKHRLIRLLLLLYCTSLHCIAFCIDNVIVVCHSQFTIVVVVVIDIVIVVHIDCFVRCLPSFNFNLV